MHSRIGFVWLIGRRILAALLSILSIVATTPGWAGTALATATQAKEQAEPISAKGALAQALNKSCPERVAASSVTEIQKKGTEIMTIITTAESAVAEGNTAGAGTLAALKAAKPADNSTMTVAGQESQANMAQAVNAFSKCGTQADLAITETSQLASELLKLPSMQTNTNNKASCQAAVKNYDSSLKPLSESLTTLKTLCTQDATASGGLFGSGGSVGNAGAALAGLGLMGAALGMGAMSGGGSGGGGSANYTSPDLSRNEANTPAVNGACPAGQHLLPGNSSVCTSNDSGSGTASNNSSGGGGNSSSHKGHAGAADGALAGGGSTTGNGNSLASGGSSNSGGIGTGNMSGTAAAAGGPGASVSGGAAGTAGASRSLAADLTAGGAGGGRYGGYDGGGGSGGSGNGENVASSVTMVSAQGMDEHGYFNWEKKGNKWRKVYLPQCKVPGRCKVRQEIRQRTLSDPLLN